MKKESATAYYQTQRQLLNAMQLSSLVPLESLPFCRLEETACQKIAWAQNLQDLYTKTHIFQI